MKRHGILIVFKKDVLRADAEAALANLRGMVETRIVYPHTKPHSFGDGSRATVVDFTRGVRTDDPVQHIETFDDTLGSPVWYIP